jgi:hypothetical protein
MVGASGALARIGMRAPFPIAAVEEHLVLTETTWQLTAAVSPRLNGAYLKNYSEIVHVLPATD